MSRDRVSPKIFNSNRHIIGHFLRIPYIPASQNRVLIFPLSRSQILTLTFVRTIDPFLTYLFSSKLQNNLSPCNSSPTLNNLNSSLLTSLAIDRANHSTETALLSLLSGVDKSQLTLLALFDMSVALEMVDHEILLQRLETSRGLEGPPLLWLRSYLSDRSEMITSGNFGTPWVPVPSDIPLGSVLGPQS